MIWKSFESCVLTWATNGSQDDEITCLKEGTLTTKNGSCCESSSSSNIEEPKPIIIADADVDSVNQEILTVQKDEDVEINI